MTRKRALDHLEAEAEAEDELVTVPIAGTPVEVLPVKDWRTRAIRAMRDGDFDTWAESSLGDGCYVIWQRVDPTLSEVEAFFEAWGEASGQSVGGSRASRRSVKSTARPSK